MSDFAAFGPSATWYSIRFDRSVTFTEQKVDLTFNNRFSIQSKAAQSFYLVDTKDSDSLQLGIVCTSLGIRRSRLPPQSLIVMYLNMTYFLCNRYKVIHYFEALRRNGGTLSLDNQRSLDSNLN